jgi:pimeloyl-ACP methyl ester carboxylesterase
VSGQIRNASACVESATMSILVTVLVVVIALAVMRWWLVRRVQSPPVLEPFDGAIYQVGEATVLERTSKDARVTVVCMHGYLESFGYFLPYYTAPDIQLIMIASAGYYTPGPATTPTWARPVTGVAGTIEYDAAVLVQALEHLPRTARIRVHGHSRGGAVVLEASMQRPDLFEKAEVVLEAPVLPGGQPRTRISGAVMWVVPFLIPLWRLQPISKRNRSIWGRLDNADKRRVISSLPFNPRRIHTMLVNLRSIKAWSERDDATRLGAVRGVVIVPGDDQVLDPATMAASAERGKPRLQVVHAPDCSHFVVYDAPQLLDLDAQRVTA